MATEPSRLEANRLYWQTDASVGAIAEQLGLSRRALYELLDAAPADGACPECGGPLTFGNRLARSTGDAYCAACAANRAAAAVIRPPSNGADVRPQEPAPGEDGDASAQNGAPAMHAPTVGPHRRGPLMPPLEPWAGPPPPRLCARDFAVAAAVGLAAGFLAAVVLSRRSG